MSTPSVAPAEASPAPRHSFPFSTLGLPLEGVGLLLAIDPIIDMARTATNVAGQALVPVIVAKRNDILDQQVYNGQHLAEDRVQDREFAAVS